MYNFFIYHNFLIVSYTIDLCKYKPIYIYIVRKIFINLQILLLLIIDYILSIYFL